MNKKLLKQAMAEKMAKFLIGEITFTPQQAKIKSDIEELLVKSYMNGYDLAVEECLKDNSRSGEDMYYFLKDLEETHE